jgi:hypothetical protein
MDPKDFPYDDFNQFIAEKQADLIRFINSPILEDVPVVIQPPSDIWGAVSGDRVLSLQHQLDALALSMKLQSDFVFTYLEPWHGVGVYANIFGCPVNWNDFDAPQTMPIIQSLDQLKNVARPNILDAELPRMILDTIDYFRETTRDRMHIVLTDTQSPNDSASLIISTNEFFAGNLTGMEYLAPFMDMLTDVMIEFSDMQLAAMGPTAVHPGHIMLSAPSLSGISVSDDNMSVISERAYRNAAFPYNSRLGDHFGGIALHTCGDFHQNYEIVQRVKNLTLVDCHVSGADPQPNNPRRLADAFAGTGILLKVGIGGEESNWGDLDDLIRPDLRLILQVVSDGNIAKSNHIYMELKDRCRKILRKSKAYI